MRGAEKPVRPVRRPLGTGHPIRSVRAGVVPPAVSNTLEIQGLPHPAEPALGVPDHVLAQNCVRCDLLASWTRLAKTRSYIYPIYIDRSKSRPLRDASLLAAAKLTGSLLN